MVRAKYTYELVLRRPSRDAHGFSRQTQFSSHLGVVNSLQTSPPPHIFPPHNNWLSSATFLVELWLLATLFGVDTTCIFKKILVMRGSSTLSVLTLLRIVRISFILLISDKNRTFPMALLLQIRLHKMLFFFALVSLSSPNFGNNKMIVWVLLNK